MWLDGLTPPECPGSPDALGTARTIVVDPSEHTRIGTMQYAETLPLGPKEVVLTFDDGPIPPYSDRILDILSAECVKATFFIVGRQARAFPERVQRAYREGHTIATHSQNHPRMFQRLPTEKAIAEIEEGFASAGAALGDRQAVAPFFRVPGLGTSAATEAYLAAHDVMVWSADFPSDDWRHISAKQVKQRALDRLEAKGQGVLLLHDIQPATVLALPDLLREFKARGYSIVHVAAVGAERPKTATTPEQWRPRAAERQVWPRTVEMRRQAPRETKPEAAQLPAPSSTELRLARRFCSRPAGDHAAAPETCPPRRLADGAHRRRALARKRRRGASHCIRSARRPEPGELRCALTARTELGAVLSPTGRKPRDRRGRDPQRPARTTACPLEHGSQLESGGAGAPDIYFHVEQRRTPRGAGRQ